MSSLWLNGDFVFECRVCGGLSILWLCRLCGCVDFMFECRVEVSAVGYGSSNWKWLRTAVRQDFNEITEHIVRRGLIIFYLIFILVVEEKNTIRPSTDLPIFKLPLRFRLLKKERAPRIPPSGESRPHSARGSD